MEFWRSGNNHKSGSKAAALQNGRVARLPPAAGRQKADLTNLFTSQRLTRAIISSG